MNKILFDTKLSNYDRCILNRIIGSFEVAKDFNIYGLVEEAVSYKCLLPSQNTIIMETYYAIKEYLIASGFLIEKKEMSDYVLTEKGEQLKSSGTLEKFEEKEWKSKRRSFIQKFFSKPPRRELPDFLTSY